MRKVLVFAAVPETAARLGLLFVPSLVGQLLLGVEFAGAGVAVARVTGIALVGLGISCWPGPPLLGMLIYSSAVAVYLACLGLAGGMTGVLLWPAVVVHLVLSILLGRASLRNLDRVGIGLSSRRDPGS
jgi:hypothetical protein